MRVQPNYRSFLTTAILGLGGLLSASSQTCAQIPPTPTNPGQPPAINVPPPNPFAPPAETSPIAPRQIPPQALNPNTESQPTVPSPSQPRTQPAETAADPEKTTDADQTQSDEPERPRHQNGLLYRYQMPTPTLPPVADRDTFYGTRYDDRDAPLHYHYWNSRRGGLYGQMLPGGCTACNAPFFRGRPGGAIGPGCEPSHPLGRMFHGVFHHLKPVGYYYAGGCWVPKYDLDPWVIGPDNFPYPFKRNHNRGG